MARNSGKSQRTSALSGGRPATPNPAAGQITPPSQAQGRVNGTSPLSDKVGRRSSAFGNLWGRYKGYLARLPQATDDLSFELGTDILERMMNDPQISASIYTLVYQALSHGLTPRPRYNDPSHPLYRPCMKMYDFISYNMDFCNDAMGSANGGIMQVLEDISVSRLVYGNNAAEWTAEVVEKGPLANKLALASLKPKPPEVYNYVVDPYGNVVGLACFTGNNLNGESSGFSPAMPYSVSGPGRFEISAENLPPGWEILPVGKFLITTHRPRFGDPRGVSALRCAYNAWYLLMTLWPDYHKYLTQFASPSIKGVLGEKAAPRYDAQTGKQTDPLDELFTLLEEFQNGSIVATRFGTLVDIIQSQGDGTAFTRAAQLLNEQMIKGIQHSILGTETAHNQTRAASSVHKDVMDLPALSLKRGTCDPLSNQVWKRLIQLNFGEQAASLLTPIASLGNIAQEDKGSLITSYAAAGWKILPSQYRGVANEMEMEPPTEEEIATLGTQMSNEAQAAANPPGAFGKPGSTQPPKDSAPQDKGGNNGSH